MSSSCQKLQGYEFYQKVLGGAKLVLAPMVDQSEYAWRILSRRYGAQVCYTPMIHAKMFCDEGNKQYRTDVWSTGKYDRPLIVQFCANDPEVLLKAALKVQDQCDAVDLNLGCPQHIARRGHYGSFLQDEWNLIYKLINTLHENLSIPVTAKIRIFPEVEKTIKYAKMIESAGAQLLTVHGRVREQKGHKTGLADWTQIRKVKYIGLESIAVLFIYYSLHLTDMQMKLIQALKIPVISNGNILYFEDIQRCLDVTGADGVMSAEGNLYNPAIFANMYPPVWQMAKEYLEICRTVPTKIAYIRGHLFKIYQPALPFHIDLREQLAKVNTFEEIFALSEELRERLMKTAAESGKDTEIRKDENGFKIFPHWICQPNIRTENGSSKKEKKEVIESNNLSDTLQREQDNNANNDSKNDNSNNSLYDEESTQFTVSSLFVESSLIS
ncbi:hypothetical protein C1645_816665 [Glomus cerebriforme]|uniref:tRNA-dihydrouridine(16/17) synthase [NAD(P)(+)] n=1 Tax=Glomus cerebriforme TaxID=658196 RepID=A0A397TES1_9GLOM|nr:hypothetical protein C1645_816665 [Glomus cerebriforme]